MRNDTIRRKAGGGLGRCPTLPGPGRREASHARLLSLRNPRVRQGLGMLMLPLGALKNTLKTPKKRNNNNKTPGSDTETNTLHAKTVVSDYRHFHRQHSGQCKWGCRPPISKALYWGPCVRGGGDRAVTSCRISQYYRMMSHQTPKARTVKGKWMV